MVVNFKRYEGMKSHEFHHLIEITVVEDESTDEVVNTMVSTLLPATWATAKYSSCRSLATLLE